ncbi:MAG TPA: penicillin-binding protein 2 [Gammaproteobacteria bacterium]|jgi:penicillin-binding protein 2|nr:penicillin-binding protein 2 [Gammaproteobacteria bacterium]
MHRKRIPIKNLHQEIQLIGKRTMLALLLIIVLIICLITRLVYLQIDKHDMYETLSTKNWLDLVPIEPTRGLIYDRKGVLLAENIPVFSLDIIPMQVPDMRKTLAELGSLVVLSPNDIQQFKKQLKQHRRFDEIPLKLRLSEEEVARLAENQYRFPGVVIRARLMRHYPFGASFSHVLGYVGRINTQELQEIDQINYSASHYIGKLGIEKYYEEELHGTVGYEQVENDAKGKPIRVLKEIKGTPGKNIYLTLDSQLQFVAEQAIAGHRGAIVIVQPATGQVLAMVSEPSYDPNLFVVGISQKDYQALQQSPDRPLFNRALRGLYPPASTLKPFIALAALHLGIITPEETIYDPGWFQLSNSTQRFRDWRRGGHGTVNVTRAIISSCDTYFFELAVKMGIRQIDTVLTQFGFGAPTGIDLEDELPGVVPSPEWKKRVKGVSWYNGDTINSVIGQGYTQVTPLQLAAATVTIANRGKRLVPYLLLSEQMPGGKPVLQAPIPLDPLPYQQQSYWDLVIRAMQGVVSPQGTGSRYGNTQTYTLAAKTGTAQVVARPKVDEEDNQDALPERFRDHHWFIAYAPVDKPQIAIAVISENSNIAIDITRTILNYYLGSNNTTVKAAPMPLNGNDNGH